MSPRDQFDDVAAKLAIDNGIDGPVIIRWPKDVARAFREAAAQRTCGNCTHWLRNDPPDCETEGACQHELGPFCRFNDASAHTAQTFGCTLFEKG